MEPPLADRIIMHIDDEFIIGELFKEYFLTQGYNNFISVDSGFLAIEEMKKRYQTDKVIDLVITDFQMPNMNGVEVSVELRKINITLPILLLTGYYPNILDYQLNMFNEIINKPISPIQLQIKLEKHLKNL